MAPMVSLHACHANAVIVHVDQHEIPIDQTSWSCAHNWPANQGTHGSVTTAFEPSEPNSLNLILVSDRQHIRCNFGLARTSASPRQRHLVRE
jgi:hypothetical protein